MSGDHPRRRPASRSSVSTRSSTSETYSSTSAPMGYCHATSSGAATSSPFERVALRHRDATRSASTDGTEQETEILQLRKSCDYCVRMKRACDGKTPCQLCARRNKSCTRSAKKKSGPAKGSKYTTRRKRELSVKGSGTSSPESSPLPQRVEMEELQLRARAAHSEAGSYGSALGHQRTVDILAAAAVAAAQAPCPPPSSQAINPLLAEVKSESESQALITAFPGILQDPSAWSRPSPEELQIVEGMEHHPVIRFTDRLHRSPSSHPGIGAAPSGSSSMAVAASAVTSWPPIIAHSRRQSSTRSQPYAVPAFAQFVPQGGQQGGIPGEGVRGQPAEGASGGVPLPPSMHSPPHSPFSPRGGSYRGPQDSFRFHQSLRMPIPQQVPPPLPTPQSPQFQPSSESGEFGLMGYATLGGPQSGVVGGRGGPPGSVPPGVRISDPRTDRLSEEVKAATSGWEARWKEEDERGQGERGEHRERGWHDGPAGL